ncbi:MAG: hypothetical protein LCH52_14145 [Bacteroidetes bacterium]|nr:hypothetical protein [Bacteroidota bacterium]
MKIKPLLHILILSLLVSFPITAQLKKDVVAKIGDREITDKEFILRYEMTPKYLAHVKGAQNALKEELIYTVAAEKLFALEAEILRLDTIKDVKKRIDQFEKMFASDALFKVEIIDRIDQTQQTLANEMAKAITKIELRAIRNSNENEIKRAFDILQSGVSFDSLFFGIYGERAFENMLTYTYGMFDYDIETKLYVKKPGEYTEPVQFNNMWYIFKIDIKRDSSFKNSTEIENEFARVKKLYVERLTDKYYKIFKKDFFKGLKINTDARLFSLFLDRFHSVLKEMYDNDKSFRESLGKDAKWTLKSDYFWLIKKGIPVDSLQLPYFSHNGKEYPLEDFIYYLAGDVREIESIDKSKLSIKVKNWTRDYIESELLAEEAMKRGLHKKPDVRREFNIWRDFTLSNAYQMLYLDSAKISDEEVKDYFIKRNSGKAGGINIKLLRAVSTDLDLLSSILAKIDSGVDFSLLAAEVNGSRNSELNGNSDKFVPASDYGEAGTIALKLNPGRIFGPVKVGEEYMILNLVDKKTDDIVYDEEYEAVKDKLKRDLGFQKYFKAMVNNTAGLAEKYKTEIDTKKIEDLKVTETNSIYFRYMGFGGKLTAFPLSKPFTDWVEVWMKQRSLNP